MALLKKWTSLFEYFEEISNFLWQLLCICDSGGEVCSQSFHKNFNKSHAAADDLRWIFPVSFFFPENGRCPFAGKAAEGGEGEEVST